MEGSLSHKVLGGGHNRTQQQQIYNSPILPESAASQLPIREEMETKLQLLLQLLHHPGIC